MDTKVDWLIWKQLKLACNNNNQLLLAMNELNKYLNLFARIYFKIHKLSLKDLWSHCIITPINIIKITLQNVPKKEKPPIWLSYSKNQISSKVTIDFKSHRFYLSLLRKQIRCFRKTRTIEKYYGEILYHDFLIKRD